ncbi:MAG: methyltransferase domain-containing protein [Candidatus Omnitrophica bacterium]|nr:methyltransferase domain-containing protein [Candidatus Omnitrophota bacterium]
MAQANQAAVCNLCGQTQHTFVYRRALESLLSGTSGDTYRISESRLSKPRTLVKCTSCGLVYALPELSRSELRQSYASMADPEYLAEEDGRRRQAAVVLSRLEKVIRGGKLLEVGCGPGVLLSEAKKRGWDTYGVELSRWAAHHARRAFGLDVFEGTLAEAGIAEGSYDAVVMLDVIEHLENPAEVLAQAARVLKPGGILYVSTPDVESAMSRFLGARWWGISKHHLFYFSRRTLKAMLQARGFKAVAWSSYPRFFTCGYWARRLEGYPGFWVRSIGRVLGIKALKNVVWKADFLDQVAVISRKTRTIEAVTAQGTARPELPDRARHKVIAVLPAYNAERTLERTVRDIPREFVDEILLVDDSSSDGTVREARRLGLRVFEHPKNRGYGANQKTCYTEAMKLGADIVVMVHPDYQYDPTLIGKLIEPIRRGEADAVFGSRMMKSGALEGGMPLWKHNANILLTAFENVMLGTYLTEYHSGFRAYSTRSLRRVRFTENSDSFLFDTEIIVQFVASHLKIEEIPIRTRYFEEASSIRLWPSICYGAGIVMTMLRYWLHTSAGWRQRRFLPRE